MNEKLDYYLKYKKRYIDVYLLIEKIFDAGKWLLMPLEVIEKLEILDKKGFQYAKFLLHIRDRSLKDLKNFSNIHSLDDILEVKEIVTKEYIENNKLDDIGKIRFLSALCNFISEEDEEFYNYVLEKVFLEENIYYFKDTMQYAYEALIHIKNLKTNANTIRIVYNSKNEIIKIFYKGNNIYENNYSRISSLGAIKFLNRKKLCLKEFKLHNPLFVLFSDEQVDNNIVFSFNEKALDLKMVCANTKILQVISCDNKEFFKSMLNLLNEYRIREQKLYDKSYPHSDFSFSIQNKNTSIVFDIIWSKRYGDYYLIVNNNKKIKFNVVEFLNLFQQIVFFIVAYNKVNNNLCLKEQVELSNKDFFKLIGIK